MNQENFERAYVESQAQIALVLAESLGLISEVKGPGEHSQAVGRRGGSARKAISRRRRRLDAVSAKQSDAARAAGHRAFYDARKAGMTADQAVTDQVTAEKEQRQRERGR